MRYTIVKRSDNIPCVYLDLENIVIDGISKDDPLLTFPVPAYPKVFIKTSPGYGYSERLDSINNLFKYLNEDDLRIIAINLLAIHNRLNICFESAGIDKLHATCIKISELLIRLNDTVNLYSKCLDFIRDQVNIISVKDSDVRTHHTEEKTYRKDDVINLHGIVFMCKILLPIFGRILFGLTKYKLNNKTKEIHCLTCVVPLFDHVCPEVKAKFEKYIKAIVSSNFIEDASAIHSGFTKSTIEMHTLANIFVRTAINHDVYRDKSNLIKAFMDAMIADTNNAKNNIKKTSCVLLREDQSATSEEKKQSQMELNSIVSHLTADVPLIAMTFSDKISRIVMDHENIGRRECARLIKDIHESHVSITPLSRLLIQTVFNRHYMGISNIAYLTLREVSQLLGVVQSIALKLDYQELAHAITAKKNGRVKTSHTDVDKAVLLGYMKLAEYRKYVDLLNEMPIRGKDMKDLFNEVVGNIVTDVTKYEYCYNSSPQIWEELKCENRNGKTIQITTDTFSQLYNFLYRFWGHS